MKRIFDLLTSCIVLLVLSPVLLFIAVLVKLDTPGPALFRQRRVGRFGRIFEILKFRTMTVHDASTGSLITVGDDIRITRSGKWLRRLKFDELPQFINVLLGDMSVVGPRPEVERYVAFYTDEERRIIQSIRPGITDNASIAFRNESDRLAQSSNPELAYTQEILPVKIQYYLAYAKNPSVFNDVIILLKTVVAIVRG